MVQVVDLPLADTPATDDLVPLYQNGALKKVTVASLVNGVPDGDKGDITTASTGTVWTINSGLSATKIADGSISDTEFQYLNGVDSNIQDQIDMKVSSDTTQDTGSDQILNLVSLTQIEYNSLTPIATTLYVIVD